MNDAAPETDTARLGPVTGAGVYYSVSGGRSELLRPAWVGEHVWMAMACFRVQPEALRGQRSDRVNLDRENLATIEVGCYVCEQPWSERLSYRECPGEPVPPMLPVA